jgi:A118 family predicted phage portal protein
MFDRLVSLIKGWWSMLFTKDTLKRALGVEIDISSPMAIALKKWSLIYVNQAEWLTGKMKSLNLGAAIASEIARAVTIEMEVTIDGSARAEYLTEQMKPVLNRLREKVELGIALGGMAMKPYPRDGKIHVDFVGANSMYPVSFDGSSNLTACIFADRRKVNDIWFTRLEYHRLEGSVYTVRNNAFRSNVEDQLGGETSLSSVDDWKDLEPEVTLANIERPLFAYFRYPVANTIDPSSPLGVSAYARALQQLEDADSIYTNLVWEFKSGKRRMYVDELALSKDPKTGNPILPEGDDHIRVLAGTSNIGEGKHLFDDWSPEFREAAINNGLNSVLKRIEFLCGLAYGTLSDPDTVDKTATEILSSKQRSAATVVDTQKALETAVDNLLYAMTAWCDIENLAPRGEYNVAYEFDDSLVADRNQQFSYDTQTRGLGLMPAYVFLERNYKLDEATAKQWIAEAQAERPNDNLFDGA